MPNDFSINRYQYTALFTNNKIKKTLLYLEIKRHIICKKKLSKNKLHVDKNIFFGDVYSRVKLESAQRGRS